MSESIVIDFREMDDVQFSCKQKKSRRSKKITNHCQIVEIHKSGGLSWRGEFDAGSIDLKDVRVRMSDYDQSILIDLPKKKRKFRYCWTEKKGCTISLKCGSKVPSSIKKNSRILPEF